MAEVPGSLCAYLRVIPCNGTYKLIIIIFIFTHTLIDMDFHYKIVSVVAAKALPKPIKMSCCVPGYHVFLF